MSNNYDVDSHTVRKRQACRIQDTNFWLLLENRVCKQKGVGGHLTLFDGNCQSQWTCKDGFAFTFRGTNGFAACSPLLSPVQLSLRTSVVQSCQSFAINATMKVQSLVFVANSLTAKRSTKSQQSPQEQSSQQPHPERMARRSPALLVLLALLSALGATAQHTSYGSMLLSEDDIIAKEIQWAKNRARMHQEGFNINPKFDFDLENEAVFTMPAHEPYRSTVRSAGSHFVANLRGSVALP